MGASLSSLIMGSIALVIIVSLAFYIYMSFVVMITGKRLGVQNATLAWIPLVGKPLVMSKAAKMPWWPVLLMIGMFIPFVGVLFAIAYIVFYFIWWWKMTEARNIPGWTTLLTFVPFLGGIWALVLWGLLAWSKK